MSVLNVISTTSVEAGATAYAEMTSGVFRITATHNDCTVKLNDGPAIVVLRTESIIVSAGKVRKAVIYTATNTANSVYTLGGAGITRNTHPFGVNDYISVIDPGNILNANFESLASAGKKVTAITPNTIVTDINASGAPAVFTYDTGTPAQVVRVAKLQSIDHPAVFEQIQIVGG